ncbi:hypothetical protein [Bradyrhizobium huanghuaihaiense]|uniref:hypothetical protein n=1 Tax=Bradyrhizobium huanghuaihaiense TaxID=990078 RepID=UPI002AA5A92B
MPVDLEWPRRANVGAIAVIGATRLASFAEVAGALYCGAPGTILQFNAPAKLVSRSNFFGLDCSVTGLFGEKSDDCAIIDSPSNTGLSLVNSICEAVTTQMRLQASKREGRFAVDKVRRLRAMSSLCRQQAAYNSMNKWKLLAEAEYWDHLAELALSSHFQQCNAIGSNEIDQPQAVANTKDAGRKTISA